MLPAKHRLTKDKEFDNAFKNGRGSYSKTFGVKAAANKQDYNRFGIIISSKVSKQATIRNKIKRQIRATIKEYLSSMKSGYDVVIICLPGAVGVEHKDIKIDLDRQFRKLGLLKNE